MAHNPQKVYDAAVLASICQRQAEHDRKTMLAKRQVLGTDALNRHAAGKPFVPDAKVQEAYNKFLATCKHRAPRRRNIQSRDGRIRASIGLNVEMELS